MTTPTRLTTADFEAFLNQPENADRRFELIDGEIVETMPSHLHGIIVSRLVYLLMTFLQANPLGYVSVEARFRPAPEADHDLIPDIAYTVRSRGIVPQGAIMGVPDLAVEVQSPGQSDQLMLRKAQIYRQHGCPLVWLVYPRLRLIEAFTPTERRLLSIGDALTGEDVLPCLTLPVADVFAGIEQP
jgi:Uma2 family endonuclease